MGLVNKLQRQKKGPWSLGERKVKVMCLEGEEVCVGGKAIACSLEGESSGSSVLQAFKSRDFRGGAKGGS